MFSPPVRDLVAIIAVLEINQWFTKLSTKDYRLVCSKSCLLVCLYTCICLSVAHSNMKSVCVCVCVYSPQMCVSRSSGWLPDLLVWKNWCWRMLGSKGAHTHIHTHTHTHTHTHLRINTHAPSYIHTFRHTHTYILSN